MQAHIDNGRKTYATGAYYCALLGEIALLEGRLVAFRQWYEDYMQAYKRFRALRAEIDKKAGLVLRSQIKCASGHKPELNMRCCQKIDWDSLRAIWVMTCCGI